jgi:hypothetical protein
MAPFWRWLSTPPVHDPSGRGLGFGGSDGVGMFNHPSSKGALNWDDYAYDAEAAKTMALIEIFGDQGRDGVNNSDAGWYWFALSRGWTVSPVMDWDWHEWTGDGVVTHPVPGASCGVRNFLPCQRSLVLAPSSSPEEILEALRASRTSASQRPDLWATLRGPGGEWQGSTVVASPGEEITLQVDAGSSTAPLTSVEIVSDNGVSAYPHYYGPNADRFIASDGHATKKARIDGPPPGTVVATVPLDGERDTETITITVPETPSERPDGKHFFYAIVHAGAPRAWTGPILTTTPSEASRARAELLRSDPFGSFGDGSKDGSTLMSATQIRSALGRLGSIGPSRFTCRLARGR